MQPERFYTTIGLFIFGALSLTLISVAFLYNQYIQGKVETYVMFFKGSLSGLETNASVSYRGVKIGEVKRIELTASKSRKNVAIPVYVEFFVEKSFVQHDDPIKILIDNGIKASITAPNILTGISSIELLQSETKTQTNNILTFHGYPKFPTEAINENEDEANDTFQTARKTLKDISNFIHSKAFNETIFTIKNSAQSVDKLAKSIDNQLPSVTMMINHSLEQFAKAANATQNLTDYLSRHPEALIRGKS